MPARCQNMKSWMTIAAGCLLVSQHALLGQTPVPSKVEQHDHEHAEAAIAPVDSVVVISLQKISAKEAGRIIKQLYAVSAAADDRTNSLIVKAPPVQTMEITALLERLDIPLTDDSGQEKPIGMDRDRRAPAENPTEALRRRFATAEQRVQKLAELHAQAADAEVEQRLADLEQSVTEAFELRQRLQRAELADFRHQLQQVSRSIEYRERIADRVIQRRIKELLEANPRGSGSNAGAHH